MKSSLIGHATIFVVVALALGCASTKPAAPPSASAADAELAPRTAAHASKEEKSAVTGPVLDRAAFIRAVLKNNPSVEAARHGVQAALARSHQSGTFEDPMIDFGMAPLSIGSSEASFGYEIGITQRLPWFGKRSFEEQASAAEAEAAQSDYEAVKRELALSAVMLYDQYFVATRSLEINANHVALMRAIHESAVAQFSSGRGSAQDAFQAESELARMENDAVMLASERDVTVAQMNELLHRSPELTLPPPPKELSLPAAPDLRSGQARDGASKKRPEILAAEQRARAEQARAERAERESLPDLTLSTSYNSMWDMPEHRWMVGVGFSLPIFADRRDGSADEARAMGAQFQSEAARMTDAARTELFTTLRKLEASRTVLSTYETRFLPLARNQIDAARAGFISGQNSFMAVIEAERNLRRIELDYQMKRAEYVNLRAALDRSLGLIPGLDWKEGKP